MKIGALRAAAICGALAIISATTPGPAEAATYTFSFSNEDGAVPGDVSGTIVLPNGDGTFAATSVVVDAFPAALNLGTPPIIAGLFEENSFTVSAGNITSGAFFGTFDASTALFLASSIGGGTGLDLRRL